MSRATIEAAGDEDRGCTANEVMKMAALHTRVHSALFQGEKGEYILGLLKVEFRLSSQQLFNQRITQKMVPSHQRTAIGDASLNQTLINSTYSCVPNAGYTYRPRIVCFVLRANCLQKVAYTR